jgi:hypothetical protein
MSDSATDTPPAVDGYIVHPPMWRAWLLVIIGLPVLALSLGMIGLWLWMVFRNWPMAMPETAVTLCLLGIGSFNLLCFANVVHFGWWQIQNRPRWVVGADQLQFIEGASRVRLSIPYTNLDAASLVKPGMGLLPFIGLRLVYPALLKFYAGDTYWTQPNLHRRFGYHWRIASTESKVPLEIVQEKLRGCLQAWRSASASSVSAPAARTATNIASSPPVQEDFGKKPL